MGNVQWSFLNVLTVHNLFLLIRSPVADCLLIPSITVLSVEFANLKKKKRKLFEFEWNIVLPVALKCRYSFFPLEFYKNREI